MADDIRFLKTKKRINDSMVSLIKEKPFHKIRLTEVCEMAQINRTTFYKHYQDIYAWKEHYEEDCRDGVKLISLHCEHRGFEQALLYFLQSMVENRDFYEMLCSDNFESSVMNDSIMLLLERLIEHQMIDIDIWGIKFYSSAVKGIIDYWINQGMKQSANEICQICMKRLGH